MQHVASTLTADQMYTSYVKGANDMQQIDRQVLIKGGSGIANKMLVTPKGAVLTPVSDEDVAVLKANPVFQLHQKEGHVRIVSKAMDGEKASADMKIGDKSAPLTPAHFMEKNAEQPEILSVSSGRVQ